MNTENEGSDVRGVYIDLDSILDTRFGVLYELDKDIIPTVMNDNYYYERLIDEFDYLTHNIFKLLYLHRDVDVIKHTYITYITDTLMTDLSLIKSNIKSNVLSIVNLTINIYPYDLSEDTVNAIVTELSDVLPIKGLYIDYINKDPDEISLDTFSSNYISLYMYNGLKWLTDKINSEDIIKNNIPHVRLNAPALLQKPIVFKDDKDYIDMYEKIINDTKHYIDLNLMPVKNFSLRK